MLRGNDVIDFMWDERQCYRNQAISASSSGPGADFRAQGGTDFRHWQGA